MTHRGIATMSGLPVATRVAVVALLIAIGIWIGYAVFTLRPGSAAGAPQDAAMLVALVAIGCCLDALVVVRCLRGRVGGLALGYLGLRTLLSVGGFLWLTLPSYAIAAFAVSRRPAAGTLTDPSRPHEFRPVSSGWYGSAMTPLDWSRNLIGARQLVARECVICGEPEDAQIHGATDA